MDVVREWMALAPVHAALIMVVALVAAAAIDLIVRRGIPRLTRLTASDLDDRLVGILRRPVFLTVVLIGAWAAASALEPTEHFMLAVGRSIQTLLVLLWLVTGLRVSRALLDGLGALAGRVAWLDERMVPLFDNVAKIVVFGAAVYGVLQVWNLDVKPWLASAGILGLALGFAAKDTLANLFGGIFIIVDAPYKLGDFITLDSGERGQVTKIGLRSTRLLTRDDVEITLPNAQIANAKIVNESGGPSEKARVEIRVGVAYGSDVDRVRTILEQAAAEVEEAVADPAPRVRFIEMGDSALVFRVLCWVERPVLRGQCIDGLNTRVYKKLVAEGINIPFPQRDVHIRTAPRGLV